MQSDLGKLFIGGISWDTDEERLKEYFSGFGEVSEAVILKDRITGRARGFGFVVFTDPAVAEKVIQERHNIDGRMVEAKKAVPRDDHNTMIRNNSIMHGSPGAGQTKKVFVGGLSSSVTETGFKNYFEQFGTVSDAVVMYDHNTQRPRGFGFITFDSEESVDKVLMMKPFHVLNGKMIEIKRAVPKELSHGSSRSPVSLSGISKILNQGYCVKMDIGRFSSPLGSSYRMGLNFEPSFEGNTSFNSYGRGISPFYIGNSNRFANAIGYEGGNGGNSSFFSSGSQSLLGNWGISPLSNQDGDNLGYGINDNGYGLYGLGGEGGSRRSSFSAGGHFTSSGGYEGSGYGDPTRRSMIHLERDDGPGSFDFMRGGNGGLDVSTKSPIGYYGGYNVAKRQINRGKDGCSMIIVKH
ncbi:heterogeneous nuclear ribonucleoprotein 1-like [Impatiens glandulifera]|uniref:heterogeneous nuclear ribonucleoprotein 1-like n=1 Tax=Impatiens glandulifera TaxID=253017 RepID=UPI001FB12654|nr:heterogeneous nuclear ribonucleoprotein 1-like [Impatiens glandulifera]